MADEYEKLQGGYGKRPLWQWVVIYLIIGAIAYGIIYYFVIAKRSGSGTSVTPQQDTQQTRPFGY